MDLKDRKIIEILSSDSSLSTQKIAKKINIPITTVHNRIKKLQKENIITKYTIKVDKKKLGKQISAYILVNADNKELKNKNKNQEDLALQIKKLEDVEKVNIITGASDLIVFVSAKDVEGLNDFVVKKLRNISGVTNTQTMVVLKET